MKVLIIGSGRMGIRHMQGVLSVQEVSAVTILDISESALENAKNATNGDNRVTTLLVGEYKPISHDVCIIASTANNRKQLINLAVESGCKSILVEKPLGQSLEEVKDLVNYASNLQTSVNVNLNMRLYDCYNKLAEDLRKCQQLQGFKTITINTGTLGIGCNGIHYLDMLFVLFDADNAELVSAEIEPNLIPSGRGPQFGDFGGWAVVNFYKKEECVGRAMVSMSSTSAAFGGWEIIAPFGRIIIDEIAATRKTTLRKVDSQLPLYRYAGDFMPLETDTFEAPFLGDLTAKWIKGLIDGKNLLPEVFESVKVHELIFDWLSKSKTYSKKFPIT